MNKINMIRELRAVYVIRASPTNAPTMMKMNNLTNLKYIGIPNSICGEICGFDVISIFLILGCLILHKKRKDKRLIIKENLINTSIF